MSVNWVGLGMVRFLYFGLLRSMLMYRQTSGRVDAVDPRETFRRNVSFSNNNNHILLYTTR